MHTGDSQVKSRWQLNCQPHRIAGKKNGDGVNEHLGRKKMIHSYSWHISLHKLLTGLPENLHAGVAPVEVI